MPILRSVEKPSAPIPRPRVVFVGDVPATAAERALLDKMSIAMRLSDAETFVTAAFSGAEAHPDAEALAAARAEIKSLLARLRPEVVLALGSVATRILLGPSARGTLLPVADLHGVHAMGTFHPRDLLQVPANKRLAWADLQVVMAQLGLVGATGG